jgi:hypothetical protein
MKQAYYRGGKMSSIRSKVAGVWVALAILASSVSLALGIVRMEATELVAVGETPSICRSVGGASSS